MCQVWELLSSSHPGPSTSLLWPVGRLLSLPSLSLCYPLLSPLSISFPWLDLGLQISFALSSLLSFSASSLSPFIY